MIELKQTNLQKTKEILNFAEKEKAFVNSIGEEKKTIYEIVESFKVSKNFKLFEIILKDKAIGLISSFPSPTRLGEDTISVGALYILPKYKGQGFGSEALKIFLKDAKSKGFKKAFTKTWSGNKASNKILENLGFKEEGRNEKNRVNGDDTIKYILEL